MTPPLKSSHASPVHRESWERRIRSAWARRAKTRGNRTLFWRMCVPAVFLLAGALFVTSANSSDGTDLRAGRYSDLASLVRQETQSLEAVRAQALALEQEVRELSSAVGDKEAKAQNERTKLLMRPAGLLAVKGPGLTVTLDDAPEEVVDSAEIAVDELVVHQQDIQAVANALWSGGAEAMTIQGQRVISTTGIKCVGNTVVLHGVPYSPPYVVTAVGDPDAMLTSVNTNRYLEIYQQYVEAYQLGWVVEPHEEVSLPGYEGSLDLDYARAPTVGGQPDDGDI